MTNDMKNVPGVMRCAKCKFQIVRTNLYIKQGTTGQGDSKIELCPNGCGPLWPVTWKEWAQEHSNISDRSKQNTEVALRLMALEQAMEEYMVGPIAYLRARASELLREWAEEKSDE
jgi:hypothetical protein